MFEHRGSKTLHGQDRQLISAFSNESLLCFNTGLSFDSGRLDEIA